MKKFLLFGAAAMLACAANAQSVEKMWQHDFKAAGADVRDVTCLTDGKAIVANKATGKVEVWDATGKVQEYDVNGFLADNAIGSAGTDGVVTPFTLGLGTSVDNAGNIVAQLQFPAVLSSTEFVIIQPDGTMQHLHMETPSPLTPGRCDVIGKIAGNVFENAYLLVCMGENAAKVKEPYVVVYNIFEGEQDADYSYAVAIDEGYAMNNDVKAEFASQELVVVGEGDDAYEVCPPFYVRNRGVNGIRYSDGESALVVVNDLDGKAIGHDAKATNTGFAVFQVEGVDYAVVPAADENGARSRYFQVKNLKTGEVVVTVKDENQGQAVGDYSATVNADGTVNIVDLNQGVTLTMYKLDFAGSSAIEEIAADNAAVEYYNLQGVKVANPENGIFVKKQGGKATKVVL